MGLFGLPRNWVYVEFDDEKLEMENVANQDTLSQKEADEFKEYWSKKAKVKAVLLTDKYGAVIKRYDY